jgi:F0F1-type ATP synthase assembly protein I
MREAFGLAINLGWTMLFSLLIPLLVGVWLDKRFATVPLFTLIGAVFGILAATVGVARMTVRTFSQYTGEKTGQEAEITDKEEPD